MLGHESLGRVSTPDRTPACTPATSWPAWSAGPTRCRARTARWASGTCAATGSTPSTASRRARVRRERLRIEPEFAVGLDPALGTLGVLLEPTSVVAKAWEHIERIGRRARGNRRRCWSPAPARSACWPRCWAASADSRCTCSTADRRPKPSWSAALGATYHTVTLPTLRMAPDVCSSAPGAAAVVLDVMTQHRADRHRLPDRRVDRRPHPGPSTLGALNREHGAGEQRGVRLGQRQPPPLRAGGRGARPGRPRLAAALITRRVPLERWAEASGARTTT